MKILNTSIKEEVYNKLLELITWKQRIERRINVTSIIVNEAIEEYWEKRKMRGDIK